MRCERLAAEHRTVVWNWGFKAFGVDAPVGELTLFLARVLCAADAGDVAEDVSEPAAEDVTFGGRHLQRFFDGIGEAVLCKAEVLKHGYEQGSKSVGSNNSSSFLALGPRTNPIRAASTIPAKWYLGS